MLRPPERRSRAEANGTTTFSFGPPTFFSTQLFYEILGWGLEDVYLATNVISRGVNVFRANDPNLVHLFHTKHCDPELSPQQYDGCLKECFSINALTYVKMGQKDVGDRFDHLCPKFL